MTIRSGFVLACIASLAACATPVTVVLSHDGRSRLSGGDGRKLIVVVPFEDARPYSAVCGVQAGEFGSDGPSITCDREPAAFLASALAAELERVGFSVEEVDRVPTSSSVPVVRGVLEQMFMQTTGGFSHFVMEADVHVRLEVDSPSGLKARRSFFAKGNLGVGGTVGGAAQESINDATNRIVTNMVAALMSLENLYPELVASPPEPTP